MLIDLARKHYIARGLAADGEENVRGYRPRHIMDHMQPAELYQPFVDRLLRHPEPIGQQRLRYKLIIGENAGIGAQYELKKLVCRRFEAQPVEFMALHHHHQARARGGLLYIINVSRAPEQPQGGQGLPLL